MPGRHRASGGSWRASAAQASPGRLGVPPEKEAARRCRARERTRWKTIFPRFEYHKEGVLYLALCGDRAAPLTIRPSTGAAWRSVSAISAKVVTGAPRDDHVAGCSEGRYSSPRRAAPRDLSAWRPGAAPARGLHRRCPAVAKSGVIWSHSAGRSLPGARAASTETS
jgi:hypothetical protein